MDLVGFFVAKIQKKMDTKYPFRVCRRIKSIQFVACEAMALNASQACDAAVRRALKHPAHMFKFFFRVWYGLCFIILVSIQK